MKWDRSEAKYSFLIFPKRTTQLCYSFTDILQRFALLIRFAYLIDLDLSTSQEVKVKSKSSVVIDFLWPVRHFIISISFLLAKKLKTKIIGLLIEFFSKWH